MASKPNYSSHFEDITIDDIEVWHNNSTNFLNIYKKGKSFNSNICNGLYIDCGNIRIGDKSCINKIEVFSHIKNGGQMFLVELETKTGDILCYKRSYMHYSVGISTLLKIRNKDKALLLELEEKLKDAENRAYIANAKFEHVSAYHELGLDS